MLIHIFTIATGIYNEYIEYQFKTIQNLFPGIQKTYNVISDRTPDFSLINCNDIIDTKYYHIINLPYPLIALHKFAYICDMCKLNNYENNDYFLFIDADTIFCDKTNCKDKNIWDKIIYNLKNNDLCYVLNPANYDKFYIYANNINKNSCSYINDIERYGNYKYGITSFLMGKINKLKELNNDICNLEAYDLNKNGYENKIIASYFDESYINKIIYDKSNNYKFNCNWYIHTNYDLKIEKNNIIDDYFNDEIWLSEYCICMQKFNYQTKINKKKSNKFDVNI